MGRGIWARNRSPNVQGVNQGISRVEGCVLKEEIVFVWLELVQKASPNSSCTTDYSFLEHFEFGLAF